MGRKRASKTAAISFNAEVDKILDFLSTVDLGNQMSTFAGFTITRSFGTTSGCMSAKTGRHNTLPSRTDRPTHVGHGRLDDWVSKFSIKIRNILVGMSATAQPRRLDW
jgi:hypothetical protein